MPVAILSILLLEAVQWLLDRTSLRHQISLLPAVLRWPLYAGFVLFVLLFGVHSQSQFIYSQF